MSISVSIQSIDETTKYLYVTGLLIASGNYPTGGDTCDFTAAVIDPDFTGPASLPLPTSKAPTQFTAESQGGLLGYQYVPVKGAALNNSKLKVSALNTFGTELSAGAYPAAVTGDSITFSAVFKKNQ